MAFNGDEGNPITLAAGAELTANFRALNPGQTQGVFIGRNNIEDLLARSESEGIRVYFGADDNGEYTIVMVSAFANENDDLGLVMNCGIKCPPECGNSNALNK